MRSAEDKSLLELWDEWKSLQEKLASNGDLWDDNYWTTDERIRYQELDADFGETRAIEHMFRAIIRKQSLENELLTKTLEATTNQLNATTKHLEASVRILKE